MTQVNRMESTKSPTVKRSASEAVLLKYVGSETNLVNMADEQHAESVRGGGLTRGHAAPTSVGRGMTLEGGQAQMPSNDAFCAAAIPSPATKGTLATGGRGDRKVMSYGAFCTQNPAATKQQRREAMQAFYSANQNFYMPKQ